MSPMAKYHAHRFPAESVLAMPETFEWFDFNMDTIRSLTDVQQRHAEFVTTRDGLFSGLHFHLVLECGDGSDPITRVDTLRDDTSWSSTYLHLFDDGMWLPEGTTIVCDTTVTLDSTCPLYNVVVSLRESDADQFLADFTWDGT